MYYKTIFNVLISTLKEYQGYGSGYGAAIILVLFILLVIVIGARAFDSR